MVNLEDFMETNIKTLGLAFMFKGAGMILGSLLIPILLNKINNELFFALSSLLLGVACLSPCTGSAYGFMVGMGVVGVATGFIAAGKLGINNALVSYYEFSEKRKHILCLI